MSTTVTTTVASAATATVASSSSSSAPSLPRSKTRTLRKNAYLSTPNLSAAYSQSSAPFTLTDAPPVPALPRQLPRKLSFSASASSRSTASRPSDASGDDPAYVLDPLSADRNYTGMSVSPSRKMAPPGTPGRLLGAATSDAPVAVGDAVDVPGNMYGTVKFIGSVAGKKGIFAGVELDYGFASSGKNNGDVDGIPYFRPTVHGAGIFLPLDRASKRGSPAPPSSPVFSPITPTGLRPGTQNSTNFTPSAPTGSKFSQSVGPDSRRPRAIASTGRPSVGGLGARTPSRFVTTPTPNRLAQSVRGTSGDSGKGGTVKAKGGIRSASGYGQVPNFDDDDGAPVGLQRTRANGSVTSGSVSSLSTRTRPVSRVNETEVERLRAQIEERDRQLMDQAAALAGMERSLAEVQSLLDNNPNALRKRASVDDKKPQQLRAMLREKNEKISMLTAEFDAHRADFRSTIDALETASTETQKLYEKRIEELTAELKELETARVESLDVNSVAIQLRQLEELVQELEEGLEDARRGEAEARGEVEFLRGEVERTRAELRREREKAVATVNGSRGSTSKEMEQKEDEIRGLKAIIHSLSRDSVPSGPMPGARAHGSQRSGSIGSQQSQHAESVGSRHTREKLEHEIAELQSMLENKNSREEQLEKEIETLRRSSVCNSTNRGSVLTSRSSGRASSLRESRDVATASNGGHSSRPSQSSFKRVMHTMETMAESDTYSTTATETSVPWCDMCESSGHDVLSCPKFGEADSPSKANGHARSESRGIRSRATGSPPGDRRDGNGLIPLRLHGGSAHGHTRAESDVKAPAPLSPVKEPAVPASLLAPAVEPPAPAFALDALRAPANKTYIIPNPMESGPVAGKGSGVVDESKWCALCERDGHESVDCPFEDAF